MRGVMLNKCGHKVGWQMAKQRLWRSRLGENNFLRLLPTINVHQTSLAFMDTMDMDSHFTMPLLVIVV